MNNLTLISIVGRERGKQHYISQRIPLEGAQSLSAMSKKKKEKVKRKKKRNKLGNTPLISFSIPLEKDPETIFFFFSSKKKKKPALTIQLTMGLWDNYSLPVFVKTDKCSTRRRATPCN